MNLDKKTKRTGAPGWVIGLVSSAVAVAVMILLQKPRATAAEVATVKTEAVETTTTTTAVEAETKVEATPLKPPQPPTPPLYKLEREWEKIERSNPWMAIVVLPSGERTLVTIWNQSVSTILLPPLPTPPKLELVTPPKPEPAP